MIDLIKREVLKAVNATDPVNLIFGKVTKAKPLEIFVHSKLTLKEEFLIVAEHLTRHERIVSLNYEYPKTWQKNPDIGDESKDTVSSRAVIGSAPSIPYERYEMKYAKMVFEDGLKIDDKVALVRMQGGNLFIVFDRYKEGKNIWSYPSKE